MVVFASVLTFGMIDGIEHALTASGDPSDLIIMRKGSNDEMSSTISIRPMPESSRTWHGIATGPDGEPLASREFVTILIKPRRNRGGTANVIVRGLDSVGRQLRPDFKIVEGRDLQTGRQRS